MKATLKSTEVNTATAMIKENFDAAIPEKINGYRVIRRKNIFTILIPCTESIYTLSVQRTRIEIINSFEDVKEVKIKKFNVQF
jgi:hypothetical protein